MNFGAFAGGLADGFGQGLRMGKSIREILKDRKREEFMKGAQAEAAAAWDAKNGGQQAASTGLPERQDAPTSGPVESQPPTVETPTTEAPAEKPAEKAAPEMPPAVTTQTPAGKEEEVTPAPKSVAAGGLPAPAEAPKPARQPADPAQRTAFIQKEMGRRAYDYFVSQGDIETAEKWLKHSETAAARAATRDWAAAYTAPDFETMVKGFGKYYTDHVNDGVDYTGHEIVTKENGVQVGVVTLKDRATGKTSKMELTKDRILQLGEAYNPAALFKSEATRAAERAKIDADLRAKKDERDFKIKETEYKEDRADQRERIKQEGQEKQTRLKATLDAQGVSARARAEMDTKVELLREAGFSDDAIAGMVPAMVGAGQHKKTTDPTERRALIQSDLAKNDPTWSRKSEDEKRRLVDEGMRIIDGANQPAGKPAAAPAAAGKPAAAPAGPIRVRDKTTGEIMIFNPADKSLTPEKKPAAAPAAAPAAPPAAQAVPAPATAAARGLPPPPAAAPAPAPAAQTRSLEQLLNPGGNPEVAKVMAPRAQQIRAAYADMAQLEQLTRQAAASGDQRSVVEAARQQQIARSKLEALLNDIDPKTRSAVMAALAQ